VVEPLENGEVKTLTAFLVFRSHLETDQDLYSGYREDILRKTENGWKIARRTIVLDANVIMSKNISIFF
jgi:3-phenylpropionate/cinnamic acid dioxygenase small subunit